MELQKENEEKHEQQVYGTITVELVGNAPAIGMQLRVTGLAKDPGYQAMAIDYLEQYKNRVWAEQWDKGKRAEAKS